MQPFIIRLAYFALVSMLCFSITGEQDSENFCKPCRCYIQYSEKLHIVAKMVDCSSLGLISIPNHLPRDIDELDLSYNYLDLLNTSSEHSLRLYASLRSISLADNDLHTLPPDFFDNATILQYIQLEGNHLDQIKPDIFHGLFYVRTIRGLSLNDIPDGLFRDQRGLRTLEIKTKQSDISLNTFKGLSLVELIFEPSNAKTLPSELFISGNTTLRSLVIIGNQLQQLSNEIIDELTLLEDITIESSSLSTLPESFFNGISTFTTLPSDPDIPPHMVNILKSAPRFIRKIKSITIRGISNLPSGIFQNLPSLRFISVKKVSNLEYGIFWKLFGLEALEVVDCGLTQLPDWWAGDLYSLRSLNLSRNCLQNITGKTLGGLSSLHSLDLSHNCLLELEQTSFDYFSRSLEYLDLTGNALSVIDTVICNSIWSIQTLKFGDNIIQVLPEQLFQSPTYLNHLELQGNGFTTLPKNLLIGLSDLTSINLSANNISSLPMNIFRDTTDLRTMDLSGNAIEKLPIGVLAHQWLLEELVLSENPLVCDCSILALVLLSKSTALKVTARCNSPDHLRGIAIELIHMEVACPDLYKRMRAIENVEQYIKKRLEHASHQDRFDDLDHDHSNWQDDDFQEPTSPSDVDRDETENKDIDDGKNNGNDWNNNGDEGKEDDDTGDNIIHGHPPIHEGGKATDGGTEPGILQSTEFIGGMSATGSLALLALLALWRKLRKKRDRAARYEVDSN